MEQLGKFALSGTCREQSTQYQLLVRTASLLKALGLLLGPCLMSIHNNIAISCEQE